MTMAPTLNLKSFIAVSDSAAFSADFILRCIGHIRIV